MVFPSLIRCFSDLRPRLPPVFPSLRPSRSGAPPGAGCIDLRLERCDCGGSPLADPLPLERRHFAQTAQATLGLTELGPKKRLDEVPRREGSNGTTAHTHHVHVVVLDSLPGPKVFVHQPDPDSIYTVC